MKKNADANDDQVASTLQEKKLTNDDREIKPATERMAKEYFDAACKYNVFGYVAVILEEESHLFFSRNLSRDPIIWIADSRMFMGEKIADTAVRVIQERFSLTIESNRFVETGRYVAGVFGGNDSTKQPIHKLILLNVLMLTRRERSRLKISGKYDGYLWKMAGEVVNSKSKEYSPLLRQVVAQYIDWLRKEGKKPYHEMLERIHNLNEIDEKEEKEKEKFKKIS